MDNSCNKICIISVYSPPADNSPLDRLERPISALTPQQINNLCMCADSNAHSTLWFNNFTDNKGEDLEDILLRYNLTIANIEDYGPTFDSGWGKSHIIVDTNISNRITEWKILSDESFSFHKLICFELKDTENIDNLNPQYDIKLTDWSIFNDTLEHLFKSSNLGDTVESLMNSTNRELNKEKIDLCVSKLTVFIQGSIAQSTPLKKKKQNSNYKIPGKKDKEIKTCFSTKRTEINWINYKTSRNEYNKQIRKEKLNDFKQTCTNAINPWEIVIK